MRILRTEDGVTYGCLDAAGTTAMAGLLAEVFSTREPVTAAVGLPRDDVFRVIGALMPKVLSERLSIVAHDSASGELVGALLADDFGTIPPSGLEELAPNFAPVGTLLHGLDERYRATSEVLPGTHVHIMMVGVPEAASSRGIARRLVEACILNAANLGYRVAITEATGAASQHIFRKLGFAELLAASYGDFQFDGVPVFAGIRGVASALLMARIIENALVQGPRRSA